MTAAAELEYSDAMAIGDGIDRERRGDPDDYGHGTGGWLLGPDGPELPCLACRRMPVWRPGWRALPGRFCALCLLTCQLMSPHPDDCRVCAVLGISDGPAALNEPKGGDRDGM
jgi:hypothetical protein